MTPLTVQGAAGQTADLQQWQSSTGTVMARISATGSANVSSIGILEGGTSPTYYTTLQGGDQSANITYTLPTTQGGANTVLANDGTGTLSWASQFDIARYTPFYYTDFLGTTGTTSAGAAYPFVSTTLSGTQSKVAGTANHPGILQIASSSTANSGGYIATDLSAFLLAGGEVFEAIFSPLSGGTSTIRMGFHNATTYNSPTNGAYCEISGLSMTGKTANSSTYSTTGTSYTLTTSSWYRAVVVLNSNATQVTYYLYDGSGNQLWTDSLTTTIPTANIGAGVIATYGTATASAIVNLDYMAVGITGRKLIR
jgi:hypothetical protein